MPVLRKFGRLVQIASERLIAAVLNVRVRASRSKYRLQLEMKCLICVYAPRMRGPMDAYAATFVRCLHLFAAAETRWIRDPTLFSLASKRLTLI